jgi:lysozyme
MRVINAAGLALIESYEGLKLCVYNDSNGYPSVGYGHKITPEDDITGVITQAEADQLLHQDLEAAENAVEEMTTVTLNDNQFSALVSLCYNIGSGNFRNSTLLRILNTGDFSAASDQFLVWDYAEHKVSEGLLRRRHAEQALFNDPNCVPPNPFMV